MKYTKYNPIFRKNLLNSLIGLKLTDIKVFVYKNNLKEDLFSSKEEFKTALFDPAPKRTITLKFSQNMGIDISWAFESFELIEISESLTNHYLVRLHSDLAQNAGGRSRSNQWTENNSISLTEIPNHRLFYLLEKEVKDISLMRMPLRARQECRGYYISSIDTYGIALEFENDTLRIHSGYKKSSRTGFYMEDIATYEGYGLYQEGKDFFHYDQIDDGENYILSDSYWDLSIKKISPPMDIENLMISRHEILDHAILDLEHRRLGVNRKVLISLLNKYDTYINYEKELVFFERLKTSLEINQCGLIDLKFGLDKNYNFKIVKPIDFIPFYVENLTFIDSIIKLLKLQMP